MNTTDKTALGVIGGTAAIGYLALMKKKKQGKPVGILGLTPEHSCKFLMAISVLSFGIILVSSLKTAKIA